MSHWNEKGLLSGFDWKNSLLAAFIAVIVATASGLLFAGEFVDSKIDKASARLVEKTFPLTDGTDLKARTELQIQQIKEQNQEIKTDLKEMRKDLQTILGELSRIKGRLPE